MADRDLRNGAMSNQKFWRKKLWRITVDSPNSPKFFAAKVFFRTIPFLFAKEQLRQIIAFSSSNNHTTTHDCASL